MKIIDDVSSQGNSVHKWNNDGGVMIQLKRKGITILTDDDIKLVSGGQGEPQPPPTQTSNACDGSQGCDGSGGCVSVWCDSHYCGSLDCNSHACGSVNCDSYGCVSVGCQSYNCDSGGCQSWECNSNGCTSFLACDSLGRCDIPIPGDPF